MLHESGMMVRDGGLVMDIAPGIRRVGSDSIVNSYLIEEGGEVTIVDAGVPGLWGGLPAELAAMGRTLDDVRAIVLTHGHSDHIGYAERARRERGWPVSVHELDAALARGEVKNPAKGGGPTKLGPILSFLWFGARKGALRQAHLGEVATFGDGATLDVPGSPRVILVPGHTPGSAALHLPARDAILVGDAHGDLRRHQRRPRSADRPVQRRRGARPGVARPPRGAGRALGAAGSRRRLRRRDRRGRPPRSRGAAPGVSGNGIGGTVEPMPVPRRYVTDAIVLSRFDLGEADRVLTLITPEHGKLKAIAKGIRRPSSRLGGSLEPFAELRVALARGRTFDVVTEVRVGHAWLALRDKLESAATAWYLAELADR